MFEENGNRNGRSSPMNEHEMTDMSLNGNHGNDIHRDGKCLFYKFEGHCLSCKCCVPDII